MAAIGVVHPAPPATAVHPARSALGWFAGGALLVFVVSFVAADLVEVHHDLYVLAYATIVLTFLASFAAHTRLDWRALLTTHLGWSVAVGVVMAVASVRTVLADPSTGHPSGAYQGFELVWRGVVYGTVDALVLYVFPAAVAYLVVGRDRHGARKKLSFAALALALSLTITATYHLGYAQFRDTDLVEPELGAVFAAVPTMLTGNPVGAVVLHDAFHVAGVVHAYWGPSFLPPDLTANAERGGGASGLVLAAIWLTAAGALVWLARDQLFPRSADGRRW